MESYTPLNFLKYVEDTGLENIEVKELNQIIDTHGVKVLDFAKFDQIYKIVSEKESNDKINRLTWWIAVMTLITTICTVISAFK